MKHEIEVSDDLTDVWADEQKVPFCVRAERVYPYYDRDNYICTRKDDAEILRSETIEGLYAQMGAYAVQHILYGEKRYNGYSYPKEGYEVEFSDIFVEVEYYSRDKMRASKDFQEIGVAREIAKKKEEERLQAERVRAAKMSHELKEKHDLEEYNRLRKKFGDV